MTTSGAGGLVCPCIRGLLPAATKVAMYKRIPSQSYLSPPRVIAAYLLRFLLPLDVLLYHFLVQTDRAHVILPSPKMSCPSLSGAVIQGDGRTSSRRFCPSDTPSPDAQMDVVRATSALHYLNLLVRQQRPQDLHNLLPLLPVQHFSPILG